MSENPEFTLARKHRQAEINEDPGDREALQEQYGYDNVWDNKEVGEAFTLESFLAPYVLCTRKSDGKRGVLEFQHHPRFYFNFIEQ